MGQKFELNFEGKDSLEEKVIIYAKLKCDPDVLQILTLNTKQITAGNGNIFCTYNTTSPKDLVEKMNVPKDQADSIIQKIEQDKANFVKAHKSDIEDFGLNFCKISLAFESENDFAQFDCDFVYVGEYSSLQRCAQAVDKGEDLYLYALREQAQKKQNAAESSFSIIQHMIVLSLKILKKSYLRGM